MLMVRAFRLSEVNVERTEALDPAELRRAGMFRDGLARRRFLAGRLAQRSFAAGLLGVPDGRLHVDYRCPTCGTGQGVDHGMPGYTIEGSRAPVILSLSRCGDWAVVAGRVQEDAAEAVGVDIEDQAAADFDGFDTVALTIAERRLTEDAPVLSRARLRTRLWTRKEALLKALGVGLTVGPDTLEVIDDPRISDLDSESLGLPTGLIVAVAQLPGPGD
jgi:4'-phosphopantetheinyl transferase